ncbi:MAG: ATP-binding protein [Burkholderiales bacterium]|nr:ATP-binding protein [Burkholderiales bacterium]
MSLVLFPSPPAAHASIEGIAPEPALLPRAPQTIDETGLSMPFLVELVAKTMYQLGLTHLTELSQQLCLGVPVTDAVCQFMRRESLIELTRRGQHDADVQYDLVQSGRGRAADWLARNSYVGPAPVPLEAYAERVRAQSVTHHKVTASTMAAAFADLVVPPRLLDLLGSGVNSGRAILLHGAAGSGKTYLAEHLQRLLGGAVAIPHAIIVHGEVIRVYDAEHHHALPATGNAARSALDSRARPDARWLSCGRPVIVSGGELTLEMLDLSFDARAGYYEAPPHFKANNGLFVVDDLGRQMISPTQLMNRWIVPMERRYDHLMLRNGGKFTIPFDLVLVFSSNLSPAQLEDAAFLRRIGHKIAVGALSAAEYRIVFERECERAGLGFDAAVFESMLRDYHAGQGQPLYAAVPRDLVDLMRGRSVYLDQPAALTPELLDWAWNAYFSRDETVPGPPAGGLT